VTPKANLLWKWLQILARTGSTVLFDLQVFGRRNVPKTGGVILAANHQSYLDPVMVATWLQRPVCFMARSSLFENRHFGWFIRELHAYPVRLGEGDIGAVKETIRLLQEGHVLNIYPEGTRSLDGEIKKMEKGIALVIRKAKVPVVPVAIDGSFQAWPKGHKLFHPQRIRVKFGKPMYLSDMKGEQIVKELEGTMRKLLAELREMR
jgi:1-acyl-sn-glycerol-3-phosphate acyltransferase